MSSTGDRLVFEALLTIVKIIQHSFMLICIERHGK